MGSTQKIQPPILLASQSPRRRELLQRMGFSFDTIHREVDETFPSSLPPEEAIGFVIRRKAEAFELESQENIVIVADTMVCLDDVIMGKPTSKDEAFHMLQTLSGLTHQVLTGVGLKYQFEELFFIEETKVTFNVLSDNEIALYIEQGHSADKAGAYGIQDWLGLIGVAEIHGSYTNVVGLPTARLYRELLGFLARC